MQFIHELKNEKLIKLIILNNHIFKLFVLNENFVLKESINYSDIYIKSANIYFINKMLCENKEKINNVLWCNF